MNKGLQTQGGVVSPSPPAPQPSSSERIVRLLVHLCGCGYVGKAEGEGWEKQKARV